MNDMVTILKIEYYPAELEGSDYNIHKGHELIRGFSREAALRFIYEMYKTHKCLGFRVDEDKKIALGASSDRFLFEIIE